MVSAVMTAKVKVTSSLNFDMLFTCNLTTCKYDRCVVLNAIYKLFSRYVQADCNAELPAVISGSVELQL